MIYCISRVLLGHSKIMMHLMVPIKPAQVESIKNISQGLITEIALVKIWLPCCQIHRWLPCFQIHRSHLCSQNTYFLRSIQNDWYLHAPLRSLLLSAFWTPDSPGFQLLPWLLLLISFAKAWMLEHRHPSWDAFCSLAAPLRLFFFLFFHWHNIK